jgi:hypothetical protein
MVCLALFACAGAFPEAVDGAMHTPACRHARTLHKRLPCSEHDQQQKITTIVVYVMILSHKCLAAVIDSVDQQRCKHGAVWVCMAEAWLAVSHVLNASNGTLAGNDVDVRMRTP